VEKLSLLSTTPAVNFPNGIVCVVNTGGKFAIGVKDTGGKFGTNLPPLSTAPVADYHW
jgi:hypothetical protein